eukprot:gnl/Hemi2/20189_TR6693_c0_g2_i1.p1 gnl/Hemi2/20189_TR6693_c0_g2~~gnl/Hemi2/20189_TR6693_c0_g2_i1.p1  ORF type:complete len:1266 (-),score=337.74 gnl/Hemi2/20189_TR6693_c0_g2_i1:65-3862(-)
MSATTAEAAKAEPPPRTLALCSTAQEQEQELKSALTAASELTDPSTRFAQFGKPFLGSLQAAAQKWQAEPVVQELVCRLLHELAAAQDCMWEPAVVDIILRALEAQPAVASVQQWGCSAVARLLSHNRYVCDTPLASHAQEFGARLQHAATAFSSSSDEAVVKAAAHLAACFLQSSAHISVMLPLVQTVLTTNLQKPAVLAACLDGLGTALQRDSDMYLWRCLFGGGIFPSLCTVMRTYPSNEAVQAACCRILLHNTAENFEHTVLDYGVVPLVKAAKAAFPTVQIIQSNASSFLSRMSTAVDKFDADLDGSNNPFRVAMAEMSREPESIPAHERALKKLAELSSVGKLCIQHRPFQFAILSALRAAMQTHSSSSSVHALAFEVLARQLTQSPNLANFLVDLGVMDVIASAATRFSQDGGVQEQFCWILAPLLAELRPSTPPPALEECFLLLKQDLKTFDAVPSLVARGLQALRAASNKPIWSVKVEVQIPTVKKLMLQHASDPAVQAPGILLLEWFLRGGVGGGKIVHAWEDLEPLPLLLSLMRTHVAVAEIVTSCLDVFVLLVNFVKASQAEIQGDEVLELVKAAMETHKEDPKLQLESCSFLLALAKHVYASATVIVGKAGFVPLVKVAMTRHAEDLNLQARACSLLLCLAQHEDNKMALAQLNLEPLVQVADNRIAQAVANDEFTNRPLKNSFPAQCAQNFALLLQEAKQTLQQQAQRAPAFRPPHPQMAPTIELPNRSGPPAEARVFCSFYAVDPDEPVIHAHSADIFFVKHTTTRHPFAVKLFKEQPNFERTVLVHDSVPSDMLISREAQDPTGLCIVYERATTTLLDRIADKAPISSAEVALIMLHILKGLQALHDNDFIHGDLKPANVAHFRNTWKLLDFDSSIKLISTDVMPSGTSHYLPPEALLSIADGKPPRASLHLDSWAAGAIMFELLAKKELYLAVCERQGLEPGEIPTPAHWAEHLPVLIKEFGRNTPTTKALTELLQIKQSARCTPTQAMALPFFASAEAGATQGFGAINAKLDDLRNASARIEDTTHANSVKLDRIEDKLDSLRNTVINITQNKYPGYYFLHCDDAAHSNWNPTNWLSDFFRLHLLCEYEDDSGKACYHKRPEHAGYELRRTREWAVTMMAGMIMLCDVLSLGDGLPFIPSGAIESFKKICSDVKSGSTKHVESVLQAQASASKDMQPSETPEKVLGAALQELGQFLKEQATPHGLTRRFLSDGSVRWSCPVHAGTAIAPTPSTEVGKQGSTCGCLIL